MLSEERYCYLLTFVTKFSWGAWYLFIILFRLWSGKLSSRFLSFLYKYMYTRFDTNYVYDIYWSWWSCAAAVQQNVTQKTDRRLTSRLCLRTGQDLGRLQGFGTEKLTRRRRVVRHRPAAGEHHHLSIRQRQSPHVQTMNIAHQTTHRWRIMIMRLCTTAPMVKWWVILEIVRRLVLHLQRIVGKEMCFCMTFNAV